MSFVEKVTSVFRVSDEIAAEDYTERASSQFGQDLGAQAPVSSAADIVNALKVAEELGLDIKVVEASFLSKAADVSLR